MNRLDKGLLGLSSPTVPSPDLAPYIQWTLLAASLPRGTSRGTSCEVSLYGCGIIPYLGRRGALWGGRGAAESGGCRLPL